MLRGVYAAVVYLGFWCARDLVLQSFAAQKMTAGNGPLLSSQTQLYTPVPPLSPVLTLSITLVPPFSPNHTLPRSRDPPTPPCHLSTCTLVHLYTPTRSHPQPVLTFPPALPVTPSTFSAAPPFPAKPSRGSPPRLPTPPTAAPPAPQFGAASASFRPPPPCTLCPTIPLPRR